MPTAKVATIVFTTPIRKRSCLRSTIDLTILHPNVRGEYDPAFLRPQNRLLGQRPICFRSLSVDKERDDHDNTIFTLTTQRTATIPFASVAAAVAHISGGRTCRSRSFRESGYVQRREHAGLRK